MSTIILTSQPTDAREIIVDYSDELTTGLTPATATVDALRRIIDDLEGPDALVSGTYRLRVRGEMDEPIRTRLAAVAGRAERDPQAIAAVQDAYTAQMGRVLATVRL